MAFIRCCVSLAVCLRSLVVSHGVMSVWHCGAAFKLLFLTNFTGTFTAPNATSIAGKGLN